MHSLFGALFLPIEALNPIVARPKLLQRTGNVLKFSELTSELLELAGSLCLPLQAEVTFSRSKLAFAKWLHFITFFT